MSYIAVNGVDHYYEWVRTEPTVANTASSPKPVMVFVHGWAGSNRYWQTTAQALSPHFDCLLYDLRGFGRSAPAPAEHMTTNPELGSLESFADDLNALLEALALERVFLNAHSLGGSIGLYFLDRYPHRVHQAILTCNGSFEYDARAFAAFYRFGSWVVAFRPSWLTQIPFAADLFMTRFLHRPIPGNEKKAFLQDFIDADHATALGTMRAAVSEHATIAMPQAFERLQVPTLLVSGQHDLIIPATLGQQAATLSERIQYVEIENTAHFPMLEDPETYLQVVLDFLQPALL
jgi:pimeloyl-ACP methyl ester carboxylesterase